MGLDIKAIMLLVNILVVHGKMYREDKYLMDRNHVERIRRTYSDDTSDFSNAGAYIFDVPNPEFKDHPETTWDAINWFPGPKYHKNRLRYGSTFPGQRNSGRGKNSKCQNVKGLPDPKSGCCGVQLSEFPYQPDDSSLWSRMFQERFRRDTDSYKTPSKMIRGGKATDLHQLPWMVRISINPFIPDLGTPKSCGGTIISSRYILTAAHCVHNTFKDLKQLDVIVAEYDSDTYPNDCIGRKCIKNHVKKVELVTIHPKYNDQYLQNDIAVLRLTSDIRYSGLSRPICLPTKDVEDFSDKKFVIAGWGFNGKSESHLKQAAFVNYVPNEECKEKYSYKDDGMFCSIGGNGEDICHGDSGGPLMVYHENKYFLSGVVNGKRHDEECGSSVPSLFNNVFYHLEWITSQVQ